MLNVQPQMPPRVRSMVGADAVAKSAPDGHTILMGAVATYVTGAEPDQVSIIDFARYEDDGVNWRVVEGSA